MPLTIQPVPLPQARQERLQSLLASNDIATLIAVVEAKEITLHADAANAMSEAVKFPAFNEKALGCMEQAVKYRHFLIVLKELKDEVHYSTVKVNQTTTP